MRSRFCFLIIGISMLQSFTFVSKIQAQTLDEKSLLGSWISISSIPGGKIETPHISKYIKYTFCKDSLLYYSTNELERGIKRNYYIKGKRVYLNKDFSFVKSKDSEGSFFMFSPENELKLFNEEGDLVDVLVQASLFETANESGIKSWKIRGRKNAPIPEQTAQFIGEQPLHTFLFSEVLQYADFKNNLAEEIKLTNRIDRSMEDTFIDVLFVVDSSAHVTLLELNIILNGASLSRQKIENKIKSTSGYWLPAINDNKKVNDTLKVIFELPGKRSMRIRKAAEKSYFKAQQRYSEANYQEAIKELTKAISLKRDELAYYLLRAECFLQLKQMDNYCDNIVQAKNICPLVKLKSKERVGSEVISVECFSK